MNKFQPIRTILLSLFAIIAVTAAAAAQTPADLDPDFFGGRVLTRVAGVTIRGAARQTDGKILVAGYFNNGPTNLTDFYVARYTPDGVLDRTFAAPLGWTALNFAPNSNDFGFAVAVAPDGKIVLSGNVSCQSVCSVQAGVARLNPDGTPDTTFSADGLATAFIGTSSDGTALAVQSDRKIVVGGSVGGLPSVSGTRFALFRFDESGALDNSFSGGTVNTEINPGGGLASQAGINGLAIQSDGRIVAAGRANCPFCPTSSNGFALTRYLTTGALDTTFSGDGKVFTNVTESSDQANAVAVLPNGKIVAAGGAFDPFTSLNSTAVVQYNADGSNDAGFGTGGIVVSRVNPTGAENAFAVAGQADNKVVVGGLYTGSPGRFLARFNTNGALDPTFDGDGINSSISFFTSEAADTLNGVFVQPDGKIVAAGNMSGNITIVRLTAGGTPDGTFGNRVRPYYFEVDDRTEAVGVQSDGRIVLVGYSGSDAVNSREIVAKRLTADGLLDTTFGSNTTAVISRAGNDETARAAKIQPDNAIVFAGPATGGGGNVCVVGRFTANGAADGTFGVTGGVTGIRLLAVGGGTACSGLALQTDGKIVVAGTAVIGGGNDFVIARYNANGTLDASFDTDGIVTTAVGTGFDESFDVAVQTDGRIVAAGKSDGFLSFVRYNANGTLDASFGSGGKFISALPVSDADGKISLALKTNGKIVAGAPTGSAGAHNFGIVRLNPNGSPDLTFDADGLVTTDFGADDVISKIGLQSNDQIVAVGSTNFSGKYDFAAARYNFDGSLDTTFDPLSAGLGDGTLGLLQTPADFNPFAFAGDGKIVAALGPVADRALTMLVQPDDKIIAAGYSEVSPGQQHFALTRFRGTPNIGAQVSVTVQTNPAGRAFTVDGTTYTGAPTFKWVVGSQHTIATVSPQAGAAGTQYVFANWSDGGALSHTVTAPVSAAVYTANFTTQHQLTMSAGAGGTVTPSSGFFDAGQSVQITATPNSGFTFANWTGTGSGSYSGSDNPATVTMNAPLTETAAFSVQCTYALNPTGVNLPPAAGGGSFAVAAPAGCAWTAASNSAWLTTSSSGSGNGTINFAFAANNGPERGATVTVGGQIFAVTQSAAGTPDDRPILLTTNRDGNFEIYRMNADGSNQQRLTSSPENETAARWSPDGTKIVFSRTISSTQIQIWTMNADGGSPALISDAAGQHVLHGWSPNGQKILFGRREASFVENLWTMNADGSGKTQITNAGTADHIASWSPNGAKIAFGRCTADSQLDDCDIFTISADGSNPANLTTDNPSDDDGAVWSPDGARIVYGRTLTGNEYNARIMNADGSAKAALTTAAAPLVYTTNKVSPDGSRVALSQRSGTIASQEIATVGLDGGNLVNLTNNGVFDNFNAWSPDGSKIAFQSRRDTAADEIYTMNADGNGVRRLTFNTASDTVTDWFRPAAARRAPFDFDGDGKTDVSVFRPADGSWWYSRSSDAGFRVFSFGAGTDALAPGDWTGDGKTDLAVWRPSTGTWFVQRSEDGSYFSFPFGAAGDVPAPADYDGDGKTDAAVFRSSTATWFILNSSGTGTSIVSFGASTDKPVPADFDGDGRADIAVFRPADGSWWYLQSSNGLFKVFSFGAGTDKPVAGDWTGDGKADIAVFRPTTGEWFVQRSEDGSYFSFPFGASGDVPAPGDYDGDGKTDAGVFRAATATWFVNRSTAGVLIQSFGATGDRPVPNAYVP